MPENPPFDLLIVTAADRHQAGAYQRQLEEIRGRGGLPARRIEVVPDPGGRRVGSGGATLQAMLAAARRSGPGSLDSRFHGRRIAIIHSGGESRRLPAFAALGKVRMPLPVPARRGGSRTMLEVVAADLAALDGPATGQVVIATGDTIVNAGNGGCSLKHAGACGIVEYASVARGRRHGVYVADADGRVRDILQKPDEEELDSTSARLPGNRVLIDTGIVSLDPSTAAAWLEGAGVVLRNGRPTVEGGLLKLLQAGRIGGIELYHELLKAMVSDIPANRYRARFAGGADAKWRLPALLRFRKAVNAVPFRAERIRSRGFLHPGTTSELIDLCAPKSGGFRFAGGIRWSGSIGERGRGLRGTVIGSSVAEGTRSAPDTVVEGSDLRGSPAQLRGRNLLSGIPAAARGEIVLRRGWCLFMIPVDRDRWAAVVHHERDDFKTTVAAGGTWGGAALDSPAIARRFEQLGSAPQPDDTLRELAVWPVATASRVLAVAQGMMRGDPPPRRVERASLAELLTRVDETRLGRQREDLRRRDLQAHVVDLLLADDALSAAEVANDLTPSAAKRVAVEVARAADAREGTSEAGRLAAAASCLDARAGMDSLPRMRRALELVGSAVAAPVPVADTDRPAAVLPDQAVWTTAPVRIDLAGGWSDTPPICTDLGGTVLNVAVNLRGMQPLQAVCRLLPEPRVVVQSVDLGRTVTWTRTRELLAPPDPTHWTALPLAALRIAGITPDRPGGSLAGRLKRLGGGLSLTISSAVPKGSGLGTSSILGATVLACLDRLTGRPFEVSDLVERTSVLEQLMATRGGWQDQVGGVVGGMKISRTVPGLAQRPNIEHLRPSPEFMRALADRTVLLFTGVQRMARDILEHVVGRYLARERAAMEIVSQLKAGAESMREDVRSGDLEGFADRLAEYWTLKQRFDPAANHPRIEAIVQPHLRDLRAWELPGAGGGGFVFMLARSPRAAARIRNRVDRQPPNSRARIFPLEIDSVGLRTAVL